MAICPPSATSPRKLNRTKHPLLERAPAAKDLLFLKGYYSPKNLNILNCSGNRAPFGSGHSPGRLRNCPAAPCVLTPHTCLLLLLETNTEAKVVGAVARGADVAPSRTQVRPDVGPGTTPSDPKRARCRAPRINHRSS